MLCACCLVCVFGLFCLGLICSLLCRLDCVGVFCVCCLLFGDVVPVVVVQYGLFVLCCCGLPCVV